MGIKRWRPIAKDRMEWAGIVREAKAVKPGVYLVTTQWSQYLF
jgi:hypothetical protein